MNSLIIIIFLMVFATQTNHLRIHENIDENQENLLAINSKTQVHDPNEAKSRVKRGFFWDVFQKMVITKNLIVDQYTDTQNTLNEVYNLINDQFSDPAPEKPRSPTTTTTTTTESSKANSDESTDSTEMTTTTEPYRISRYELGRIIGRNFRGLQRLQDIEFQDALNQSQYNIQEYREEANKQFANSIAVEKKKHLRSLKG